MKGVLSRCIKSYRNGSSSSRHPPITLYLASSYVISPIFVSLLAGRSAYGLWLGRRFAGALVYHYKQPRHDHHYERCFAQQRHQFPLHGWARLFLPGRHQPARWRRLWQQQNVCHGAGNLQYYRTSPKHLDTGRHRLYARFQYHRESRAKPCDHPHCRWRACYLYLHQPLEGHLQYPRVPRSE